MKIFVAFLISALSFPGQFFGEFPPKAPDPERIEWEADRSWFHNTKNLATETVRADCEFWQKCFGFVILAQFILFIVVIIRG
jgi:hypothetical protein